MARWLEVLSQYNFEIQHRAGAKHGNADAMSRLPTVDGDCDGFDEGIQLADLPCGGCKVCTRKQMQWAPFAETDDVVPLTGKQPGP